MDLDLQVVLGVAPEARIIDYQNTDRTPISLGHSIGDIYNQVEQDGLTKIVSTSYALCEGQLLGGDLQLTDNALKALEASNVTAFVASGDTGAYACLRSAHIQPATNLGSQYTGLAVNYPASSPYAISVGGTRLESRADLALGRRWRGLIRRAQAGLATGSRRHQTDGQPEWSPGGAGRVGTV